jgi:chromosomal replication initiator protein
MIGQVRRVLNTICAARGVTRADLLGPERSRRVSWPRQEAYTLLRETTLLSFSEIGRQIGGRDHTTVLKGVTAVSGRCARDPGYASGVDELRRLVAVGSKPVFFRHGAELGFSSMRAKT